MKWLPEHKCGLRLSHNEHRDFYETIEQFYNSEDFISPEEWLKAVAKDSVWVLHWYPETPIGFIRIAASTLDAIKEALMSVPDGAQPSVSVEQEPVAWRYKPVREDNPRWEYTTNHPLDMGDGYLRPSLVEYCKCIEPLYAKEKPKLMLEKFREMKDLLDDTTPPQRTWVGLTDEELELLNDCGDTDSYKFARAIEAALRSKNT